MREELYGIPAATILEVCSGEVCSSGWNKPIYKREEVESPRLIDEMEPGWGSIWKVAMLLGIGIRRQKAG